MTDTNIKDVLPRIIGGQHLSSDEMEQLIGALMSGAFTSAQIAALLTALKIKHETIDEITGAARAMRKKMTRIETEIWPIVDCCGTGGDARGTFNISTTAAFVVSACGVTVAKHGNRSVSSRSGSTNVLDALGIDVKLNPNAIVRCLTEAGLAFLHAPSLHPAMRFVAKTRQELGFRTLFNLLGPLCNPAGATIQLVGIYDSGLRNQYAQVLRNLGAQHAMVVSGRDGMDEITLTALTDVTEIVDGKIKSWVLDPRDYGLERCTPDDLKGGSPEENAETTEAILAGEETGPKRDVVLLNAAALIMMAGDVDDLKGGIDRARDAIDSGQALAKLDALRWLAPKSAVGA